MRRREVAAGGPGAAGRQRIGVLIGDLAENDPTGIAYVSAERRGGELILETG